MKCSILALFLAACAVNLDYTAHTPDATGHDSSDSGATADTGDTGDDTGGDSADTGADSGLDSGDTDTEDSGGGADCSMGPAVSAPRGERSVTTADALVTGDTTGLGLGAALTAAGDADGDGCGDVLIAADGGAEFWLFRSPLSARADRSAAWATWTRATTGTPAGAAGGTDLDGDGHEDLALAMYSQGVYVDFGPIAAGTRTVDTADVELLGLSGQLAGIAVAAPGDITGDGADDLLVGGMGDKGRAWVVSGPLIAGSFVLDDAAVVLDGQASGDAAGGGLAGLGDVNGDGLADFVVGAQSAGLGAGRAYVYYSPAPTVDEGLGSADAIIEGDTRGDQLARSVAGPGDVDGDGHADMLVGTLEHNEVPGDGPGYGYLFLGGTLAGKVSASAADSIFQGEADADRVGYPVAGAGDLDADGYPDLVFGAELNDRGGLDAGAAFVVYSPPPSGMMDLSGADAVLVGAHRGDSTGLSVAAGGDIDADGFDDLLLSAPTYSDTWSQQGAAFVFRGGAP